jgi:hypothetical protein
LLARDHNHRRPLNRFTRAKSTPRDNAATFAGEVPNGYRFVFTASIKENLRRHQESFPRHTC